MPNLPSTFRIELDIYDTKGPARHLGFNVKGPAAALKIVVRQQELDRYSEGAAHITAKAYPSGKLTMWCGAETQGIQLGEQIVLESNRHNLDWLDEQDLKKIRRKKKHERQLSRGRDKRKYAKLKARREAHAESVPGGATEDQG